MANVGAPQPPQNQPRENPMMGLFLDRPAHTIDPKGLSACNNVRIELGRLRSDLLGWVTAANFTSVPGGTLYMDTFVTAGGRQFVIAVSPTDIYVLYDSQSPAAYSSNYQLRYATPLVTNRGVLSPSSVAITTGTTAVTGTNTTWKHSYQTGTNINGTAAQGATQITITSGDPLDLQPGQIITCSTAGVIANGTQYVGDVSPNIIKLSLPTTNVLTSAMTVTIGNGTGDGAAGTRWNILPGDFIAFRNPSSAGDLFPIVGNDTWYQIASVNSDTSLTLATTYTGSTLSGSAYMVRQCLKGGSNAGAVLVNESEVFISAELGAVPVSPSSGQAAFSDTWFYTNGFDPVVMIWAVQNGAQTNANQAFGSQYPPSIPFLAKSLKAYKGIMVYGGIGFPASTWPVTSAIKPATTFTQGNEIASSDSSTPNQLNSGIAFQGIAISGPFTIGKLGILGQVLMLYGIGSEAAGAATEDNHSGVVTSASLVGFPTIWSFSDVIQTRGPISGEAVAIFSDRHQFISIDGEYRYNGLFIQIMNDQVWREVLLGLDYTRRQAFFHYQCSAHGDLIWAVPQSTDPANQTYASSAYVEHYMEQANSYLFKPYTKRDFPFTACCTYQPAGAASPGSPIYLASDPTGTIWQLYSSNTQNGTAALATATWGSRPIGNGRSKMLVTRVYPEIQYQASPIGNVSITLTLQNYAEGPVTITDTQSFNPSYANGVGWTTHYRRGSVGAITLSDQLGVGWVTAGYDWDYTLGGVRLS